MKFLALLAAASLLAAPAAAPAQGKPPAPPEADAGSDPETDAEMLEMLRAAVEDMREQMYKPGPPVANWDQGGGDPDGALRTAGADSHFLLQTSVDGDSVIALTRRPIASFAPAAWRMVDSYGTAEAAVDNPFLQFTALTPRYVLASRANTRRVATADCSDPVAHAVLYEVLGAPDSEDDEDIPMLFRLFLLASEDVIVCTRYEREGAAAWRPRAFLPDGRSLPQLDNNTDRVRVVPAAPLETLVRAGARGPRTST